MNGRIIPVILSGGAGTRLWPLSTPERPKQLLGLLGVETMLQTTALRVGDRARFEPPIVVTNKVQAGPAERQLAEAGAAPGLLIVEPSARNTAPAIALAALAAPPEALLLVLPSDHLIADPAAFLAAVAAAAPLAEEGWLATFGIRPDRPETGYGYIKRGEELAPGVHRADRFVEKPDAATAARYVEEGSYEWNGGIFLFRADAFLAGLREHAPDILDSVRSAFAEGRREGALLHPDAERFAAARSQSIDHAVMEHAGRVAVAPVEMGWSDVGSWDVLHAVSEKDEAGNAIAGAVTALDASGSLLRSEGPRIVAVGIEDLIVVATKDAVLVLPRGQSQRVAEALQAVKRSADAEGAGGPSGPERR